MIYSINGYWKDDQSEFDGYLVTDYDSCPEGMDDDDIFYYGLVEKDIQGSIESKRDDGLEFVITSYEKHV